jgi:hypothetical protein
MGAVHTYWAFVAASSIDSSNIFHVNGTALKIRHRKQELFIGSQSYDHLNVSTNNQPSFFIEKRPEFQTNEVKCLAVYAPSTHAYNVY